MAKLLTDSYVATLRPTKGQIGWREIADGGCRGLHLKLSDRGEKVWAVRHMVGGKRRRHIIGGYPAVSLSKARKRADQYLSAARDGMTAGEMDARTRAMSMTVAMAHAEYLEAIGSLLRPGTLYLKKGMFRHHISPRIGSRLIRTIRKPDVFEVVTPIKKNFQVQANRVFSELMALLRWCDQKGYIDGIPSIRKKGYCNKGTTETPHADRCRNWRALAHCWWLRAADARLYSPASINGPAFKRGARDDLERD